MLTADRAAPGDEGTSEATTDTYDAIVIGSGMSGLTSAIILAKEGKRVLVLEQHYRPGGFLHRFYRKGGVKFDVGFHYLGGIERDQVLGTYLRYLGVYDQLRLLAMDPQGYDRVIYPTVDFMVPSGRERYEARLMERFPREQQAIRDYFTTMREVCNGFAFYNIHPDENQRHALQWLGTPLGPFLRERFSDPDLIRVLVGQNPLYGVEPERTPVALHALVTESFAMNAYSLEGGGDALARAMVERIRALGGEVRTRRRVTQIHVDDQRRVSGVSTERGETFRAPLVVSCAHPKVTIRLLPKEVLRPGYRRRVLGMEDGIATLSIFVTTRAELDRYWGHNIYRYWVHSPDRLYTNVDRPPEFVFATVPTAREGRTKEGLHEVIGLGYMDWQRVAPWADSFTGERGPDYEAFKQREGEALLELLIDVIPELRGQVESLEVATPLTNRDYGASDKGAAYGIHHSVEQSGRYGLRPRTRVSGLYLTGQSVLMPGVLGVTISAFHTCAQILGQEYLIGRVRELL